MAPASALFWDRLAAFRTERKALRAAQTALAKTMKSEEKHKARLTQAAKTLAVADLREILIAKGA